MRRPFSQLLPPLPWPPGPWGRVFTILLVSYLLSHALFAFVVGPNDYDLMTSYYELAWRFWGSGQRGPGYNPFLAGGRTLAGDPQIPIFHPLTWLVPVLSAPVVVRLEMLFQLALGVFGIAKLLRWLAASREATCWGVFLFASGGAVVARFLVGHVTLGFFLFFPLLIYLGFVVAEATPHRRHRWRVAYWAAMAYAGWYKPNFFIYAVPPLLVEALVRSWLQRRLRPAFEFGIAVAVGAGIDAVTILPAASYFRNFPRIADRDPHWDPWYTAIFNLLLPLKTLPKALYGPGFRHRHEYNLCVGAVGLFFAGLGLRGWRRAPDRAWWGSLLAMAIASFALGLGRSTEGFSLFEPLTWIQNLWPGMDSVRVPARFWFALFVGVVLFSARGHRNPGVKWKAAYWGLGVVPLVLQTVVNLYLATSDAATTAWATSRAYRPKVEWVHAELNQTYDPIKQGFAVIDSHENIEVFRSPKFPVGDALDLTLSGPALAKVNWIDWSHIRVDIEGMPGDRLIAEFNLNHHPYWQLSDPHVAIRSHAYDRLRLDSPDGAIHGELSFVQPRVRESRVATALALSLALLSLPVDWLWRRRRRRRCVGLTGPIGSGKSEFGALLARDPAVAVFDLDQIGREVLATDAKVQAAYLALARRHGCTTVDGKAVDRKKLRLAIAADPKIRRRLERTLQPAIVRAFRARAAASPARVVVGEAALWVQHHYQTRLDLLVGCFAAIPVRQPRIEARDALAAVDAAAFLALQGEADEARRVCDVIVVNDGERAHLEARAEALLAEWREMGWL